MVLFNDIDDELTRRGLDTRIGGCIYSDTAYEPTCEHIKNPDRFFMILVAIERYYDHTMAVMAHLKIFNTKSEYAQ